MQLNLVEKSVITSISQAEERLFKTPQLPALRAIVRVQLLLSPAQCSPAAETNCSKSVPQIDPERDLRPTRVQRCPHGFHTPLLCPSGGTDATWPPAGHTAAHGLEKQRPSFFFLQFAPVSKVGPGFRPELRSAYSRMRCLPHPRVGKISFPGHAGNGATGALPTGETILGCDPAFSFVLRKRGRRRETVRTDLLHNGGNSGPNRPEAAGDPYPSRKRGTQGLTGGYVGLFRSTRRLVIRWRSVDSSNYSR